MKINIGNRNSLISELKILAKKELEANRRFHDYAHAISVFNNAQEIIKGEHAQNRVNALAILAAALFHDISNSDKHDSLDSAKKVHKLLESVKNFPKELIIEVERLIISIESGRMDDDALDELIINDADSLEALSKLSICRGLMICGKRGLNVHLAIQDCKILIDRKYKELHKQDHTKTAKRIANKQMPFIKKFLDDCLKLYEK
jgi:HD superfamily phosphodiesterase